MEKGKVEEAEGESRKTPLVLIPDYRFAGRAELDNDPTGMYHKRCDIQCENLWGYIGNQRIMGNRCIGCGYTVWLDPFNGGIGDERDKEMIWCATKQTEAILNQFRITVEEAEGDRDIKKPGG